VEDLMICVAPCPGEMEERECARPMDVVVEVVGAHAAGASIAHLHVRDQTGRQTVELAWFQRNLTLVQEACPIILEGSTGGAPEHTRAERCVSFRAPGIEMGSLNLGSTNMGDGVYANAYGDVKYYASELRSRAIKPVLYAFDLSHVHTAFRLVEEGLIGPPYAFNLVFDVPNGLPFRDRYLEFLVRELPDESVWFLTRHHALGAAGLRAALERGGHVRIGHEDGPFLSDGSRARTNAELVDDIVRAAEAVGRRIAGADRARELLGLPQCASQAWASAPPG